MLSFEVTVPILGGPPPAPRPEPERWLPPRRVAPGVTLKLSRSGWTSLLRCVRRRRADPLVWLILARRGLELSLAPAGPHRLPPGRPAEGKGKEDGQGDEDIPLLALTACADCFARAGVVPYPHQLQAVRRVLGSMGGRALLADEVGLGKTIEAGLILKECQLRGLVERALILVPPSLAWQWHMELREKFGIRAPIQRTVEDWELHPVLIASIDTAKRAPHADRAASVPWDLLIVDEAHRLKNERSQNFRFVSRLPNRFCLLLTATPLQNGLKELYNLIHLLRPGELGTYRAFKARFGGEGRQARDPAGLRATLARVMIRTRRAEAGIQLPPRVIHALRVRPAPSEQQVYQLVSAWIRETYRQVGQAGGLWLITLQREICSSFWAAARTLDMVAARTGDPGLQRLAVLVKGAFALERHSKLAALVDLVRRLEEPVIVFTEYRATQELILYGLRRSGIAALGFDGSMGPGKKAWIRSLFARDGRVLVSTEAGGEGWNFQFCRRVIHYDLPWNPMRLEQRIGRVHRLGQTREVHIHTLVTEGTIEEHILFLLHEKLDLFRQVIGGAEELLDQEDLGGSPGGWDSFEGRVMRTILDARSDQDARERLARLADELLQTYARRAKAGVDALSAT